jgi:hypothetical protein
MSPPWKSSCRAKFDPTCALFAISKRSPVDADLAKVRLETLIWLLSIDPVFFIRFGRAEAQVSSVRLPPEFHDLEQAGYAKITPLNLQECRVEITLAGRVALQRVARQAQRAH